MLDIGVVIPQLSKYGGAERLVVECITRWQHKHKITIYAERFNSEMLEEHGIGRDVALRTLSPQIEGNTYSFLLNATFTPKLWSGEIGQHDVYNTHLWPLHLLDLEPAVWYPHEPLRMLYDLKNDKDLISITSEEERRVHIYPKYNYDNVNKSFFQPMLRSASSFDKTGNPFRIVANSKYCASYIESVYGRQASRVVYPGVTVEDFLPPIANEYILTIAQLWPHKRIHLILQSMRLMDNMQLYIVGSGPEKQQLIRQAKELGVYDRTFFLSDLTNHEIQIVFSRALAVVFMPVREPFGIVALEAMAAAKPLVAVNEGGYIEVVDDRCSFLIPPHADVLAEKLLWLKQHPLESAAMGVHGRELAQQYSWDRTAKELLEELEDAHDAWKNKNSLQLTSSNDGPIFGAHYYGWYGNGLGSEHWNDSAETGTVTEMPQLGYYSSTSGDILEQHLHMAENVGLDFFFFNLHINSNGPIQREMEAFSLMLERAAYLKSSVKICLQLCLYDCTEAILEKIWITLFSKVFRHPTYQQFKGKPLLSIFWTGQYDGDVAFLKNLRKHSAPVTLLASSLRLYPPHEEPALTFGAFDGWSLFSPLELASPEHREKLWREAYSHASAGQQGIRCFTVSPGYDDTALVASARQWNSHRNVPREDGKVYRQMWDTAYTLPQPPDIMIISTFNEFHENTQIESTVSSGSQYLELTRSAIKRGKDTWKK